MSDKFAAGTPPFSHYFTEFCATCRPGNEKSKVYDCRVRCVGRSDKERCGYPLREAAGANLDRGLCADCQTDRVRHRDIDIGGALRLMAAVVTQAKSEAHYSATARGLLLAAKDSETIIGQFVSYAAIKEGLSHEARLVL